MITSEANVRVRYAETDQAGYVYYGNYAQYYELGRVAAMRKIGHTYREMEERGVIMPVLSMNIKYIRPAKYDDLLTIKTFIKTIPETRMNFEYEIYNQNGELINIGETTLAFISKETYRPTRAPERFIKALKIAMQQ